MALSPPPYKTPMLEKTGVISRVWATWFRDLFERSGGSVAPITVEEHIDDPTDAHRASAIRFTPTGSIAATQVQGAIAEVASEAAAALAGQQAEIDAINAALVGLDGASAYEVAVENGFVGTEEEWLESLIGATGPIGLTGSPGPQGSVGVQGPEGPPGGAINTQFAVSSLAGHIYTSSLTGDAYLLEFA